MEEKRKVPHHVETRRKAIEARSKINPIETVDFITAISNRIKNDLQQIDKENKHIQELCGSGQLEHLSDYLSVIDYIQFQYDQIQWVSKKVSQELFAWHCW